MTAYTLEAEPRRGGHAWWIVPVAAGVCDAIFLRFKGADALLAFGMGVLFAGVTGWKFGRDL